MPIFPLVAQHGHLDSIIRHLLPPSFFDSYDRNIPADAAVDATDDHWFYTTMRGKINFTDVERSLFLWKPSNDPATESHHHSYAHPVQGFDLAGNRASYDIILNWILNGAPQ